MTSVHDYQKLVDQLLTNADEIRDRIGKLDRAINDRSSVNKEHADADTVSANHWNACREAIRTAGGDNALLLVDNSAQPPADSPTSTVSDQNLTSQIAAVENAAAQYRTAQLQHQHYQTRWARRLHRALLVVGAVLACFLAVIVIKILFAVVAAIVTAVVGALATIAILGAIIIALYFWLS